MEQLYVYFWVMLGIIISVLLPIMWTQLKRYFPVSATSKLPIASIWTVVKPYVILGIASGLTSILIVAFLSDQLADYRAALLAGYAWDSTLQKLR
jgi:hypothetical protein